MKNFYIVIALIFLAASLYAEPIVIQNDNGSPRSQSSSSKAGWEESVFLIPSGPCEVKEVSIYFSGKTPGTDTVYIVGDPAEGSIPPTLWVASYNTKYKFVVTYNGTEGWQTFPVTGVRSDGLDRICIQHRVQPGGPWFAADNNGTSTPYKSFLLDPEKLNSLNIPGTYYLADGDLMVRITVEYDYPLGQGSAPPPPPALVDFTKEAGLVTSEGNFIPATDAAVVDWNNDGWDDIAIGSYFFENNKDGTFKNVGQKLKIRSGNTSWADIDNDGDLDLYSQMNGNFVSDKLMVESQDRIFINNGNGVFTELDPRDAFVPPYPSPSIDFNLTPKGSQDSIPNPYSNISPLWLDYNGDGYLDLYLANNRSAWSVGSNYMEIYYPDQLWLSNRNLTFSNVRESAGIATAEPMGSSGYFDCYGANACDYNLDGKADIFVANYRLARDILFKNNSNGTFTDKGSETGVMGVPTAQSGYYGHGMGSEWGDFNNDALPDLCVGNLGHPDWRGSVSNPSLIYRNDGPPDYKFTEVHGPIGLKFFEMNAGVCWADLDLDGYLDLIHGQISYDARGNGVDRLTRVYINQGPQKNFFLKDETWKLGSIVHGCWSPLRIDFDNDGDLDIIAASNTEYLKLFRNDIINNQTNKGNWIAFRLSGNPSEKVPMDAFGSKIIIYKDNQKFYRELIGNLSGTKCSQNSFELHFGLGNIDKIDSVVVFYPNGKSNKLLNLVVNKRYRIPYMSTPTSGILSAPRQIYPGNNQTRVKLQDDFKWYAAPDAVSYLVQVSENPNFSNIILEKNVESLTQKISLPKANATYYWRIKYNTKDASSPWSSTWIFCSGYPTPGKITLAEPADKSTGISALAALKWNATSYSFPYDIDTKYILQISENQEFSGDVKELKEITALTTTLAEPLKPNQLYFWRARAVNQGAEGEWSDLFSFTTKALPAKIVLSDPPDKSVGVSLKPRLKWKNDQLANAFEVNVATDDQFSNIIFIKEKVLFYTYTFSEPLPPDTLLFWRVRGMNDGGKGEWSETWSFTTTVVSVPEIQSDAGITVSFSSNPFSSAFKMMIESEGCNRCNIFITNVLGQNISEVYSGNLQPGIHEIKWLPEGISSGMYYCVIYFGDKKISYPVSYYK